MSAALGLAEQGFRCFLVEKEAELGGIARRVHTTIDGKDVQAYLKGVTEHVLSHPRIAVFLETSVRAFSGYLGNFRTEVSAAGKETMALEHGVAVVATGGEELKPKEYLYGKAPQVVTQLELEETIALDRARIQGLKEVVMIQCVGSRNAERPYCSRVCCAEAVKNAIAVKALNPGARVVVLYRDMRTYGLLEEHYAQARKTGILFLRYDEKRPPEVMQENGRLNLALESPVLGERLSFRPDLLVLSSGYRAFGYGQSCRGPQGAQDYRWLFPGSPHEAAACRFRDRRHLPLRRCPFPEGDRRMSLPGGCGGGAGLHRAEQG